MKDARIRKLISDLETLRTSENTTVITDACHALWELKQVQDTLREQQCGMTRDDE